MRECLQLLLALNLANDIISSLFLQNWGCLLRSTNRLRDQILIIANRSCGLVFFGAKNTRLLSYYYFKCQITEWTEGAKMLSTLYLYQNEAVKFSQKVKTNSNWMLTCRCILSEIHFILADNIIKWGPA